MSTPPRITLVFTKGAGKSDRLEVHRPDGRVERLDCPKQRIAPHDMVHYAVEHTLALRGFLGRVADGEAADFHMQGQAESDGVERLVEVVQGDAWSGGQTPAEEMLALYAVTCAARACPPLRLGPDDLEAVRTALRALDARWAAEPVGGTLTLGL